MKTMSDPVNPPVEPAVTPPAPSSTTPPATPSAEPPKAPEPPKQLLGDEPKAEPDKPAEPPKEPEKPAAIDLKTLKLPEGMELAPESLEAFEPVAKELGLSQESAQRLMDIHTAALKQATEASYRAYETMQTSWVDEIKADKEIGGDNLTPTLASISKVLTQFGDPNIKSALSLTGAGNNPAIVRTLARMAKALTEGGHIAGVPPKAPEGKGAHALYPNLSQN